MCTCDFFSFFSPRYFPTMRSSSKHLLFAEWEYHVFFGRMWTTVDSYVLWFCFNHYIIHVELLLQSIYRIHHHFPFLCGKDFAFSLWSDYILMVWSFWKHFTNFRYWSWIVQMPFDFKSKQCSDYLFNPN